MVYVCGGCLRYRREIIVRNIVGGGETVSESQKMGG